MSQNQPNRTLEQKQEGPAETSEKPKRTPEVSEGKEQRAELARGILRPTFDAKKLNKANLPTELSKIQRLSVDDFKKAELKSEGTGLHLFARLTQDDEPKPVPYGRKLQKGEKIVINFLGNDDAENHYGMRTLFKHNPEIRRVRINHKSPRGRGRNGIATRHSWNGNFYFESGPHEGKYAPIFSDTEVEIIDTWSKEEAENQKREYKFFTIDEEGKDKRGIDKEGMEFFRKEYQIHPPQSEEEHAWREYFRRIDRETLIEPALAARMSVESPQTTEQPQRARTQRARQRQAEGRSINRAQEQHERMHEFHSKWNEINAINSPQRLIEMVEEINMHDNDPIIRVPDEPRNIRLRSGAALRYALFKRYIELKGYKVIITSGFRSVRQQAIIWNRGFERRRARLAREHPNKSSEKINRLAEQANRRFIARPGSSHHNTGGAIDIRIYDRNGQEIPRHKFSGSRSAFDQALKTGDLSRLSRDDRQAVGTRLFMDRELMASHYLGCNYYRETWHWDLDCKQVYTNV